MNSVLFIDIDSSFGHINLNKVYLQQFRDLGFKVNVIVRKGYFYDIGVSSKEVALGIPEEYFKSNLGKIGYRITKWRILQFIRKNIRIENYNCVFFSYFDEFSFVLSGIKGNLYFLNHSNVSGLDNIFKRFFLRRISKMGTIVVFHETIKKQFTKFGIENVIEEPLGLSQPYSIDNVTQFRILNNLDKRLCDKGFVLKIFIPTLSKYGDSLFKNALFDISFTDFLIERKILMVIKNNAINIVHPNICVFNSYLEFEEYQSIFLISDFILLNYPSSFKDKVSASLFECFSNNKPCFVSDIKSFRLFQNHFKYDPYYSNINDLKMLIEKRLSNLGHLNYYGFAKLNILNPTFEKIIRFIESNDK